MISDCQKCGACCTYFHKDEQRENGSPLWAVHIHPSHKSVPFKFVQIGRTLHIADSQKDLDEGRDYFTNRFVKSNGLQCAALEGVIGEKVSCAIYENRPPVCRKFEVGSDRCLEARNSELNKPTETKT